MESMIKLKVCGLKRHYYLSRNYDDIRNRKSVKEIICLKTKSGEKYELTLSTKVGDCPSGYTTATWASYKINKVIGFGPITHYISLPESTISKYISFELSDGNIILPERYKCPFFEYDLDGGDCWYPEGDISVNDCMFIPTGRGFDKRPVWLFRGNSGTGKSFIASKLEKMEVYETDSSSKLPDRILADVIVLGNKYEYDIEEIQTRISGKLVIVDFSQ